MESLSSGHAVARSARRGRQGGHGGARLASLAFLFGVLLATRWHRDHNHRGAASGTLKALERHRELGKGQQLQRREEGTAADFNDEDFDDFDEEEED